MTFYMRVFHLDRRLGRRFPPPTQKANCAQGIGRKLGLSLDGVVLPTLSVSGRRRLEGFHFLSAVNTGVVLAAGCVKRVFACLCNDMSLDAVTTVGIVVGIVTGAVGSTECAPPTRRTAQYTDSSLLLDATLWALPPTCAAESIRGRALVVVDGEAHAAGVVTIPHQKTEEQ
jgi:hypothetical protein